MTSLFIWIPCCLVWTWLVFAALGLVVTSFYTHFMKKKDKPPVTTISKKPTGDVRSISLSTSSRIKQWLKSFLYGLCRYYSIIIGRIPSHHIRKLLLQSCLCMKIDKKAVIYGGFEIRSPWNISIGKSVIGVGALLDGRSGIQIKDNVTLAQNVCIFTLQHDVNDPHFQTIGKSGAVVIDEYAWVSSNSTILPRVHVGEGAVLASSAVATKNLEPYTVNAGIPAKKISDRNQDLRYTPTNGYWHFY